MSNNPTHRSTNVAAHPQRDSSINPNSISLLTQETASSIPSNSGHLNKTIRAVPSNSEASNSYHPENQSHISDPAMAHKTSSEDTHISPSLLVNSAELQDCEFEPSAPEASLYSSASEWAAAPQIAHDSYYLDTGDHKDAHVADEYSADVTTPQLLRHSPSREIKRSPQSVEVLHLSENNAEFHQPKAVSNQNLAAHELPRSQSLHQALQAATLPNNSKTSSYDDHSDNFYALESYQTNNVDEDDEERGPSMLESLPTPRVASPKAGFSTDSFRTSTSQPTLSHLGLNSPPSSAPLDPLAQRWSGVRDSTASSLMLSQSPQLSQSSTSDKSGSSTSPRLAPVRPKSAASTRLMHRQSYYDFAQSTNNFNLSLTDAANAAVNTNRGGNVLIPRMKTIELYRRNARKTNDPELEFQLAQYMIQTALMATSDKAADRAKPDADAEHNGTPTSVASSNYRSVKSSSTTGSNASKYSEVALERPVDKQVEKIFKEAMSSLKRLSERGFADAQYLLGDIYSSGALAKLDMERSFKYFLMAAKHGHAEAAYRVALCFQEGWGTSRDAARAIQFYNTAAVRNQPGALYQLGMAYFHGGMGLGDTSANKLAGVKWLSRAVNVSDQIYNRAPHELAKIYEVGFKDLVIADNGYAIKLYAHSADLGFIPSAARLGRAYEFGELGCPQDPNLSIHYNTIAALGNDPKAQLAMCAWYMVGAGPSFPVNHDEAFEWALRAALNGLPKAQFTLGFFYENGTGIRRNIVEASKWYRRAAENGHEKAIAKLKSLGVANNDKQKGKCSVM